MRASRCETCIYNTDSPLNLERLENEIRDPHFEGHFKSYRICHHTKDACCRGFWNRHKDNFDLGQMAQRFGMVEFTDEDRMAR